MNKNKEMKYRKFVVEICPDWDGTDEIIITEETEESTKTSMMRDDEIDSFMNIVKRFDESFTK